MVRAFGASRLDVRPLSHLAVRAFSVTTTQLFADAGFGATFMDKVDLPDTFGSILTVLILLEFDHLIFVALTQRTGDPGSYRRC
jgi:hypothetical protein